MHKLQNVYYVIGIKCYKRKYQFNDYDIFIRDIFNQEKIKKENRKDFTVQYYNKSKEKWCQFSILYKHISPNKFKIKVNTSTIKKGKYEQEYAIVLKEKNEIIHTFDTFTIILIVKE